MNDIFIKPIAQLTDRTYTYRLSLALTMALMTRALRLLFKITLKYIFVISHLKAIIKCNIPYNMNFMHFVEFKTSKRYYQ